MPESDKSTPAQPTTKGGQSESVRGSGAKEFRETVIAQPLPIAPAANPAKVVEPTTSLVDSPPPSGSTESPASDS